MKTNKLFVLVLSTILLVTAMIVSSLGCSIVVEGTMEDLKGTYQLTTYKRTLNDATDEKPATVTDYLAENSIEMYLVITGESIGYVSYKDNQTSLIVREVSLSYKSLNEETPDKVGEVSYEVMGFSRELGLMTGISNLGFVKTSKWLNRTQRHYGKGLKLEYTDTFYFSRVSTDVDLKYINKKFGQVEVKNYAYTKVAETFSYSFNSNLATDNSGVFGPYLYYVIKFNQDLTSADIYYALKSDLVKNEKTNVAVSVTLSEDKLNVDTITVDSIAYKLSAFSLYNSTLNAGESVTQLQSSLESTSVFDLNYQPDYLINEYLTVVPQ